MGMSPRSNPRALGRTHRSKPISRSRPRLGLRADLRRVRPKGWPRQPSPVPALFCRPGPWGGLTTGGRANPPHGPIRRAGRPTPTGPRVSRAGDEAIRPRPGVPAGCIPRVSGGGVNRQGRKERQEDAKEKERLPDAVRGRPGAPGAGNTPTPSHSWRLLRFELFVLEAVWHSVSGSPSVSSAT